MDPASSCGKAIKKLLEWGQARSGGPKAEFEDVTIIAACLPRGAAIVFVGRCSPSMHAPTTPAVSGSFVIPFQHTTLHVQHSRSKCGTHIAVSLSLPLLGSGTCVGAHISPSAVAAWVAPDIDVKHNGISIPHRIALTQAVFEKYCSASPGSRQIDGLSGV